MVETNSTEKVHYLPSHSTLMIRSQCILCDSGVVFHFFRIMQKEPNVLGVTNSVK